MRIVIQRVSEAKVTIDGIVNGAIEKGFMILLGIHNDDTKDDADWLCNKIIGLRVFADAQGQMNLDIKAVDGNILLISQFTLHASYKKGNRPSFLDAARPDKAIPLYEYLVTRLNKLMDKPIATGIFGADMQVSITNDGPVTIIMDSRNRG
jgi:D-tyrosyl-tRNA(Tyr) deacylase